MQQMAGALPALAGASALEAMQKLVKDQNQALAKAQLAAQEAQAKARTLQERCQSLEEDATSLRCELGHCVLCFGTGAKTTAVHVVAESSVHFREHMSEQMRDCALRVYWICQHGCPASVVGVQS